MAFPVVFHIGYNKTATSWLQEQIFPLHSEIEYLGHSASFSLNKYKHSWARKIIYASLFDFHRDQGQIKEELNEAVEKSEGRRLLLSNEGLTGSIWNRSMDALQYAHRLQELAPDGGVLVCIRNQFSMLLSLYFQYIIEGGVASFADFFVKANGGNFYFFSLDHLKYDRLISYYKNLFGA